MSLKTLFKTDPKIANEGVWVEYPANSDGSIPAFLLSRMSKVNKRYTKELRKATTPVQREIELGTLDEDRSERIMLDVFCRTIILDCRNLQPEDDGKVLAYTADAISKLLSDPEWSDLYADLQDKANKAALFRISSREGQLKNS